MKRLSALFLLTVETLENVPACPLAAEALDNVPASHLKEKALEQVLVSPLTEEPLETVLVSPRDFRARLLSNGRVTEEPAHIPPDRGAA